MIEGICCLYSLSLALSHTHTHINTHSHAHTHTHARTHMHFLSLTHTHTGGPFESCLSTTIRSFSCHLSQITQICDNELNKATHTHEPTWFCAAGEHQLCMTQRHDVLQLCERTWFICAHMNEHIWIMLKSCFVGLFCRSLLCVYFDMMNEHKWIMLIWMNTYE